MDTLRWILLIIGILVLAGIYVVGKRGEWRERRGGEHYDPRFDGEGPDVLGLSEPTQEWVDDVRPVYREPGDQGKTQEPAFIASRDEPASSAQAPSLEIDPAVEEPSQTDRAPELSASRREDNYRPEDGWADDVRSVWREADGDVPALHPDRSPDWMADAGHDDVEPAEDGWVDDVRPIKREIPPTTTDAAQRIIPEDVASEVSASEETHANDDNERPEDVLIIHVVADAAVGRFKGRELASAFNDLGLSFGPQSIYYREAGIGAPMFSVLNRLKPGTFDPKRMDEMHTSGLILFMPLPGPDQPMVAFRAMRDCARKLAERLGGHLEDEQHEAMTPEMLSRYEKRVRSFTSGLYRRMKEAAENPPEPQDAASERDSAGTTATQPSDRQTGEFGEPSEFERPHPGTVRSKPKMWSEAADRRVMQGIAERAGSSARKLLSRYEERVQSFMSALPRRTPEPRDDDRDPLMRRAGDDVRDPLMRRAEDDVRDPLMRQRSEDKPETPPENGNPPQSHPDAEQQVFADQAPTRNYADAQRSTLQRAASRFKSVGRKQAHVEPEPGMPDELLIIHIVADPAIGTFDGDQLAEAFKVCDLHFGAMQIYHRKARSGTPMFSVVNMLQPGTFDPENFSELETPGISLFMQLPGPEQPMVAFRGMSDCARRLVEQLGGRLQDETRSTMTMQTLNYYEERVRSFIQRQACLAGGRRA